jgi:pyruvate/2-oxoglutarate dehydrogenase complex dihydrolipoamide acyltransferase (E2) component
MATEIILPELGGNIESVIVKHWNFNEGDRVNEGEDLVELEVQNRVLNLPCPVNGVILEILVDEGDEVEIGEALVTIEEE